MNPKQPVRILICTGHTGGHFFPAVSFAETFQSIHSETEIHILMSRMPQFAERFQQEHPFKFHIISLTPPPSFFSFKMLIFLLQCISVFCRTFFLLIRTKPALVVGFGSYGSAPGVLCAAILRIPVLLHEQNASAGRANQFLAMWADQIAISFPETQGRFPHKKIFWSGYPLRPSFLKGIDKIHNEALAKNKFTILVFGGSQGAKRISDIFLKALGALSAVERSRLAVIHNVGSGDLQEIEQAYQDLGIAADVRTFSYQIVEQYKRADLVVSRAGAGTIFELAALGRAAILIPYPHAYAHQKLNAADLIRRDSAQVIYDEELSADKLRETMLSLKDNLSRRRQLAENIKRLAKKDANEALVRAGWKLICEKN